jgi:hypothetical protein
MAYTKPVVLAQNSKNGIFAAACGAAQPDRGKCGCSVHT